MISVFSGRSADDVWQQMARTFQRSSTARVQSGRGGKTKEILHATLSISDPRQRWVMSRRPAMNPAFALAEVVWIINGRRDLTFLQFWNRRIGEYVGPGPNLHGAYGYRLRLHMGVDQLEQAYQALKNNPETRQVVLQIWDSGIDMPRSDGSPSDKDIPCNVMALPKVRAGKLEWMQIVRSNDLFLGVPHNIVQFTTIQEIIAGWLGVECGTFNQISDSLHMYRHDESKVRRSPPSLSNAVNSDSLALPRKDSELAWRELGHRMERFIDSALTEDELERLSLWNDVPQSYRNVLTVLAAEAARRHGWKEIAHGFMSRCTNPCFTELWSNWMDRVESAPTAVRTEEAFPTHRSAKKRSQQLSVNSD